MHAGDAQALIETGDPAANSRAFRRCLGHFATGVTVITAEHEGARVGITANSFSSVSLDPPIVLWSIAMTSTSRPVFAAASHFAINILSSEQMALASQFAQTGRDKFENVAWKPGLGGAPLLEGAAARLQCEREAEHPGGDHIIVLGRVRHFERFERAPLAFVQGRFGMIADHPDSISRHPPGPASGGEHTLLTLFRLAYLRRLGAFQVEAAGMGLSVMESRLLYHLAAREEASIAAIARDAMFDLRESRDAAADLVARGLLEKTRPDHVRVSPEGHELLDDLKRIAAASEKAAVARLPAADVEAARRVLAEFAFPDG